MEILIKINGDTIQAQADPDTRLLDVLRRFPIGFPAPCGGHGNCGGCQVALQDAGTVLACRTTVGEASSLAGHPDRLVLVLPDTVIAQIMTDAAGFQVELDPLVAREDVTLPLPALSDQRTDAERFQDVTGHTLTLDALRRLPRRMREHDGALSCIVRRDTSETIDLISKDATGPYGVAVDIGTTTLAAYLFHLGTGKPLGHRSMINPQEAFGADVISRIGAASASRRDQATMRERICFAIRELASALAADAIRKGEDVQLDEIHLYAAAGNTTMLHLLADVDPDAIARSPFIPAFTSMMVLPSSAIGLTTSSRSLCALLPSVSAYVGADIVCGIIACGMETDNGKNRLLIDIGTNGEIALAAGGRLIACSAAAGPAFEGANILFGMSAVTGAIDHVFIKDGELAYTWIGSASGPAIAGGPAGLCGSAILDTVRVLLEQGLISFTGRLDDSRPGPLGKRVIDNGGQQAFVIEDGSVHPVKKTILFRQEDIREVQNAKAAIAAGIGTLLSAAGLRPEQVDEIYLAGGFGNYLDPESAIAIGLLPGAFAGRIRASGNTAGIGASMCLLSRKSLALAADVARRTEYVELSANPGFSDRYIDEMVFPEQDEEE